MKTSRIIKEITSITLKKKKNSYKLKIKGTEVKIKIVDLQKMKKRKKLFPKGMKGQERKGGRKELKKEGRGLKMGVGKRRRK